MQGGETPIRRHAAWGLTCLALLVVSPYFERLNNPNENVRVWATRAIVQHHVLNIDALQREWGYVNDKAKNEHHIYSGKAPGVSFAGVPVSWAHAKLRGLVGWPAPGKQETTFWLRLFAVKLPLCVFLFFFARYVERTAGSTYARDLLVVALGLGTLLYPYGGMFVGHALAAATAFTAFMLLDDDREGRLPVALRLAIAGLFAGLTVIFEYQAALVSAAVAVYAGVRYRRQLAALAAFVAGALPPAVALGIYHTVLFGRPWRLPLGNVENPVYAATAHSAGFHGLSVPQLKAVPAFLFSPSYGLFAFSPVLALGVAGVVVLFARARQMPGARRDAALVTAVCLLMFTFLAGMSNWRGGWCVGPRYIASVAPFLVLPIIKLWPRFGSKWWATALVVGLTIPSVVLNVVSGALYPHYPEQYDNPVFDLAFPLLGAGYAPHGLGHALHLPGAWAMAPLALVIVAALALVASGDDPRPRRAAGHIALALAIAAAFLLALSAYGHRPNPDEARATSTVRQLWEPAARTKN
jgi:hypothetical protein